MYLLQSANGACVMKLKTSIAGAQTAFGAFLPGRAISRASHETECPLQGPL